MNTLLEARAALRQVSRSPRLYVADGFATDAEIDHILRRAASIQARRPAHMLFHETCAGFSFEMAAGRDPVLRRLMDDTYAAAGLRNVLDDTLRFRRYSPGNAHPGHCDVYQMEGCHLLATAILYLDDADGGETEFPRAENGPIRVEPRRGRLALWFNYTADGQVDQSAFHAGLAVRSGVKTTITNFFYNRLELSANPLPGEPASAAR